MTARSIYTLAYPSLSFGLTGVGYDPRKGSLMRSTQTDDTDKTRQSGEQKVIETSMEFSAMQALFGVACICNNATYSIEDDKHAQVTYSGQPTELALIIGAAKSKVLDPRTQYHRIQEVPFTSDRKRMEVIARPLSEHSCQAFKLAAQRKKSVNGFKNDGALYFVKGMPEAILGECQSHIAADSSATTFTEKGRRRVLSQSRRMASSGLRVLAMAYGPSLDDLTFAGLVGMEDPPREGVPEAVLNLQQSGVRVMMLTGDSKETALAIGKRCGIIGPKQAALEMQNESDIGDSSPVSHNPFDDLEFGAGLGKTLHLFIYTIFKHIHILTIFLTHSIEW